MLTWTTNDHVRITSCRLTAEQVDRAKVLGGPREYGGIVEIELDGETIFGRLLGQVTNRDGLQLSTIVWPTYADAVRAQAWSRVSGPGHEADADEIDRLLAR